METNNFMGLIRGVSSALFRVVDGRSRNKTSHSTYYLYINYVNKLFITLLCRVISGKLLVSNTRLDRGSVTTGRSHI